VVSAPVGGLTSRCTHWSDALHGLRAISDTLHPASATESLEARWASRISDPQRWLMGAISQAVHPAASYREQVNSSYPFPFRQARAETGVDLKVSSGQRLLGGVP